MYNIEAVMHWCFDCTNKRHSNNAYASDRSYGLDLENWTHVQLCQRVQSPR